MTSIDEWLKEYSIDEVEAVIPDMTGIARGKLVPARKYSQESGIRLPESIFLQTVTGDYPRDVSTLNPADVDMILKPDVSTIRMVPWAVDPTALVIHDAYYHDGEVVEISPRHILRRVINLYRERGWQPILAPELEFYLVKPNTDSDYPLQPPIGRSGREESGRQSFSIDAVNEFDPLWEDVYDYCEAQNIDIDTLVHESGAAQMEVNLLHGDPLNLADQAFIFKRTIREAALRHKMYATFMGKPMMNEPGSAMHMHQSVVDIESGRNVFSNPDGAESELFFSHIGGLQKYLPAALAMLAPNVNSYRRFIRHLAAPINLQWGYDNRTTGLRVPISSAEARRVENRVAGADANPYLAIAASLACGFLGMTENLTPSPPLEGSGYDLGYDLPRSLEGSLALMKESEALSRTMGDKFLRAYRAIKETEYETFLHVISSWEREHLLLNV